MFWWRKRNEGFEWRDYVRTTILVRREQRRQRLKDIQSAAAAHVKDAGRRGLDASVSGARSAGTGAWSHLKAAAITLGAWGIRASKTIGYAISAAAAGLWTIASALAERIGERLGPVLEPVLSRVREPKPNLALKIVAALAGHGAVYRSWMFGFDGDALVAAVLAGLSAALVLLAYLTDPFRTRHASTRESLLARLHGHEFELPGNARISARTAGLAVAGLAAIAAVGAAAYKYGGAVSTAEVAPTPTTAGALSEPNPSKLEGRALAISGDRLRIAGTVVVLDGIEAPEAGQSCRRSTGSWRCGAAAKDALAGLVRGRRISCDLISEEETEKRARCHAGAVDIAEQLVKSGNVFSNGSFLSRYADIESKAQKAKVGLWAGDAERPQDYRDKRWGEAKRDAPEGCPIKGRIRSGTRTYVLPWSPSYDSIRLSTSKGERWFCSESEAQAAGWKLAS